MGERESKVASSGIHYTHTRITDTASTREAKKVLPLRRGQEAAAQAADLERYDLAAELADLALHAPLGVLREEVSRARETLRPDAAQRPERVDPEDSQDDLPGAHVCLGQ